MGLQGNSKTPIVDDWTPNDQEVIFRSSKNIIIAPIDRFYHLEGQPNSNSLNCFMLNTKKSYNSEDLRSHYCHYVNYFEKFFDPELEYFTNMSHLKFLIDCFPEYQVNNFLYDINRYIIQPSIFGKVKNMVDYNYSLQLNYKSINSPQLQYTDEHAKALLHMSILMNLCIPLITHFIYIKRIADVDEFILDVYDKILYYPDFANVDIPSKLYQTSISNVKRNEKNNAVLWAKQDIRGKDVITHSQSAVKNIILNIMPKYEFDQNMISLNYTSIQKNNKFQISDISYEFNYVSLSSAASDAEDSSSELDKYEANLSKADESIYLQAQYNCCKTMQVIEKMYGPFDEREIDFYLNEMKDDNGEIMNGFQRQLVFNLFYKYFVDTQSINGINARDYVKLILAAKTMLKKSMMVYLPYIISAKADKIVGRKSLNKREMAKIEASQYYPLIQEKYKQEKIVKQILGTVATIITSSFRIIDFDPNNYELSIGCNNNSIAHAGKLNGTPINVETDMIIEECLLYILLI